MDIGFSISGEYITNLARNMLWKEQKDINYCIELLESCLMDDSISNDKRRNIAIEILEGRKRLIGENNFELVNDNEDIKPLTNIINRQKRELEMKAVENDFLCRPWIYYDINISTHWIPKPHSLEELMDSLKHEKNRAGRLESGLYMLDKTPSEIAIIMDGKIPSDIEEANKYITIYHNKQLQELKDSGIEDYNQMSRYYQLIYTRSEKVCYHYGLDFPYGKHTYEELWQIKKKEKENERRRRDEYNESYAKELLRKESERRGYDIEGTYFPKFEYSGYGMSGFLAPDGKFYKCKFGYHGAFARYLTETVKISNEEELKYVTMGVFSGDGSYVHIHDKLTKKQVDFFEKYWNFLNPAQKLYMPFEVKGDD